MERSLCEEMGPSPVWEQESAESERAGRQFWDISRQQHFQNCLINLNVINSHSICTWICLMLPQALVNVSCVSLLKRFKCICDSLVFWLNVKAQQKDYVNSLLKHTIPTEHRFVYYSHLSLSPLLEAFLSWLNNHSVINEIAKLTEELWFKKYICVRTTKLSWLKLSYWNHS